MVLSVVGCVPKPWLLPILSSSVVFCSEKTCQSMCLGLYLYCSRKSLHMETNSWNQPPHGISLHMESIGHELIKLTVNTQYTQSGSLYLPHLAVLIWTHGNLLLSTSCLEISSVLFIECHCLIERK